MASFDLPDLEGAFEPTTSSREQLSGLYNTPDEVTRTTITEQVLRKTYYRLSFQQVSYGTYDGSPACLLVIDAYFHADDSHRHRFTSVRINIEFLKSNPSDEQVEVKEIAPELAYGKSILEQHSTSWSFGSHVLMEVPGIPAFINLFDAQRQHNVTYSLTRTACLKGTKRGYPKQNKVAWTLEEAKQEGIPLRVPSLVMLIKYQAGTQFKAKFFLAASVGFSLNPQRWSMAVARDEPVVFDEGRPKGKKLDADLASLDIKSLTQLRFDE